MKYPTVLEPLKYNIKNSYMQTLFYFCEMYSTYVNQSFLRD